MAQYRQQGASLSNYLACFHTQQGKAKITSYVIKLGCLLSLSICGMNQGYAYIHNECHWELSVLGPSSGPNKELSITQDQKDILLGISYKPGYQQYNYYYALVTSDQHAIADKDVIKYLNQMNFHPLETMHADRASAVDRGFYRVGSAKQPVSIIYLIAAVEKIHALERLGAGIKPMINHHKLIRRGGSDFTGQIKNSIDIDQQNENDIARYNVHVCSYELN